MLPCVMIFFLNFDFASIYQPNAISLIYFTYHWPFKRPIQNMIFLTLKRIYAYARKLVFWMRPCIYVLAWNFTIPARKIFLVKYMRRLLWQIYFRTVLMKDSFLFCSRLVLKLPHFDNNFRHIALPFTCSIFQPIWEGLWNFSFSVYY